MNLNINLKVYDAEGINVVKVLQATAYDLRFGTIRALMEIVRVEEIDNQAELLKVIAGAWGEVVDVLAKFFPEATDKDWDNVKVKELLPTIIDIAKYSVSETFNIPTEKN